MSDESKKMVLRSYQLQAPRRTAFLVNNNIQHSGLSAVERFKSQLPHKPMCTNNPRHGQYPRWLRRALTFSHINPNKAYECHCIVIDLDHADSGARWIDVGAPRPHFIVKNPSNGHAHYIYLLQSPVGVSSTEYHNRKGPWSYFKAIRKGLTELLDGDHGYQHGLAKNPLSDAWDTITADLPLYTLADLGEALITAGIWDSEEEARPGRVMKERTQPSAEGRNQTVFDGLRIWAYQNVSRFFAEGGTYLEWRQKLSGQAAHYNAQFDRPLAANELRTIVRSVADWTYQKRGNLGLKAVIGGVRRRRIEPHLRDEMEPEEAKQRIREAQAHGAKTKVEATRSSITQAVQGLQAEGKKITQAAVAQRAGLTTRTIRNHIDLLNQLTAKAVPSSQDNSYLRYKADSPSISSFSPASQVAIQDGPMNPRKGQEVAIAAQVIRDETGQEPTYEQVADLVGLPPFGVRVYQDWLDVTNYHDLCARHGLSPDGKEVLASSA